MNLSPTNWNANMKGEWYVFITLIKPESDNVIYQKKTRRGTMNV